MAPVTVITRYVPLVVGWLAAWWMLWRLPVPRPLDPGADVDGTLDDVAVVIPARDEAANLPILLDSLTAAQTAGVEVLVIRPNARQAEVQGLNLIPDWSQGT